ncbi:MAG: 4Fe-4S dicluster domain-containing protein [Deltaproteobacteria bacterium]|nr:4Fe-4S dicluster domain-containing protein [Deltaproteobacteria bacterium]MBW1862430.1 4Fe-4S dicluster domain-containing protein [Deltaproteobacteria bacterium]
MPIKEISGCNGCGTCFEVCPMDVIRMNEETKTAEIRYPRDCQCCNLCVVFCPEDAITLTKDKYWPLMTAWG